MSWVLAAHAVLPATMRSYIRDWDKFVKYFYDVHLGQLGRPWPASDVDFDTVMSEWVQYRFLRDTRRGTMMQCKRAVQCARFWHPVLELPFTGKTLAGWDRLVPAGATTPVPKGLMLLLVDHFLNQGQVELAMITAVSFECMLRTSSELLTLLVEDVDLPGSAGDWTGSELGAIRLRQAKSGRNQSVTLNLSVGTFLLAVVVRERQVCGDARLCTVSPKEWRLAFAHALSSLGVPAGIFRPYALRHGGATDAFLSGEGITEVAFRGRWKFVSTVEKYVRAGQAMLVTFQLPESLRKRSRQLIQRPSLLLNRQ